MEDIRVRKICLAVMKGWRWAQFIWPLWTSHQYAAVRIYGSGDFSPGLFFQVDSVYPHCLTGSQAVTIVSISRFINGSQKLRQPQIPQLKMVERGFSTRNLPYGGNVRGSIFAALRPFPGEREEGFRCRPTSSRSVNAEMLKCDGHIQRRCHAVIYRLCFRRGESEYVSPQAQSKLNDMEPKSILKSHEVNEWICQDWKSRAVWTVAFCAALWILFYDLLTAFVNRWSNEPQYSHGFAIPIMAVWLGWYLSDRITVGVAQSSKWSLLCIAAGIVLHVLSVYLFVEIGDCIALLLCITGTILLIWGRRLVVGVWPAIMFLMFMFPLPFRVERMLSGPLQLFGAEEAAYYIQTCGIPAVAKGSMILMGDHKLGVAEACSGMRMLTVFVAISAATMIVCKRTIWEKTIILFSSVPIALICNIARIVATALAHHLFGQKMADLVFHDLSGWLMMPSAMLLLYLELKLLDWLFVPSANTEEKLRTVRTAGLPGVLPIAQSH